MRTAIVWHTPRGWTWGIAFDIRNGQFFPTSQSAVADAEEHRYTVVNVIGDEHSCEKCDDQIATVTGL